MQEAWVAQPQFPPRVAMAGRGTEGAFTSCSSSDSLICLTGDHEILDG